MVWKKGRGVVSVISSFRRFWGQKCDVIEQFDNLGGGGDTVRNLIIIVNKKFHKMQQIQSMDCLKWKCQAKTKQFSQAKDSKCLASHE